MTKIQDSTEMQNLSPKIEAMETYNGETLEERIAKSKNLKIALVCVPNMGHLVPISYIATALKERGHEVTVISIDNEQGKRVCP